MFCAFVLYCTGSGRTLATRLSVSAGAIAAACLLLAAASAFTIPFAGSAACNVGTVLLIAAGFLLCAKQREKHVSILLAFLSGILAWFLLRIFPSFFEPAFLLALPAVILSQLLPSGIRQKMLCVVLSPLFFGLTAALEDWYLFDKIFFSFGNAMQFNTQVVSLFLLVALSGMQKWKPKKVFDMQKEY